MLMTGTNDSIEKSSDELIYELLSLKKWIRDILPDVKVTISCPTIRLDHQKAGITILRIRQKLSNLNIDVIINENISNEHLGKKGLHLNSRGSGRLVMNYLSHIHKHQQLSPTVQTFTQQRNIILLKLKVNMRGKSLLIQIMFLLMVFMMELANQTSILLHTALVLMPLLLILNNLI